LADSCASRNAGQKASPATPPCVRFYCVLPCRVGRRASPNGATGVCFRASSRRKVSPLFRGLCAWAMCGRMASPHGAQGRSFRASSRRRASPNSASRARLRAVGEASRPTVSPPPQAAKQRRSHTPDEARKFRTMEKHEGRGGRESPVAGIARSARVGHRAFPSRPPPDPFFVRNFRGPSQGAGLHQAA
jgi:hypothetical protein